MINRDDFTEPDLAEMASAVFDGEASADERQFVNEHPRGPALLAGYAAFRDDLREAELRDADLAAPGEEVFAQMRARALAEADAATPATPPSTAGKPVTDLASRRRWRSLGPRLVGVAAVALVGVGAMAIANLDRDSSSGDSASSSRARTELDAASGGGTAEASPKAPTGAAESADELGADDGVLVDDYLGAFDKVDDLEDSYRQRVASFGTSPLPQSNPTDGATGTSGTVADQPSPSEVSKFAACGDRSARAILAGQDVVLRESSNQIQVLDATTCALIAAFDP